MSKEERISQLEEDIVLVLETLQHDVLDQLSALTRRNVELEERVTTLEKQLKEKN